MLVFGCTVFAQDQSKLEGWKPYAPTRLEWLAVNLNAQLRVDFSAHNSYAMGFVPFEKEDAIIIYVSYLPSVDRPTMNIAISAEVRHRINELIEQ